MPVQTASPTARQTVPGRPVRVTGQELLETTDDTVDTIAAATGFGTATTLRRHFNRTVGVPPDSYRRTFRSRPQPGLNDSRQHHQLP